MGIDINKAIIKALPDEAGNEQMTDFITNLANAAFESHEQKVKYQFLMKALKRLSVVEKNNLPGPGDVLSATLEIDVDGIEYTKTFKLVKPLAIQPIYELRINIEEFNWRFRATFFPKYHNDKFYYCFVYPFLKYLDDIDPTDDLRDRTYKLLQEIRINPDKYFHF